jgi:GT2 family glycosyltransferase
MPKVSAILVIYNSRKFLPHVLPALLAQRHADTEYIAVISESKDGSKEYIQENFPAIRVIDPGRNLGFAGGNNLGIRQSGGEFIQLINPDLIIEPDYIANLLKAFVDPKVAAATGKLLRYDFERGEKTGIIDSTGIVMSKSGRGKDRGQLERDSGQYDSMREVFGVSGAGPMYRRSALDVVAYQGQYFDEAFLAYWEDVDLSWRLNNAGFKNVYAPQALAYHGRTVGQSKGGYLHFWHYIVHHGKMPAFFRRLNYRNHILMYLKNSRSIHPAFLLREFIMFFYVLVLETSTLGILPDLFRQLKSIKEKRRASLRT